MKRSNGRSKANIGLAFFPPSVVDAEIKERVLCSLNISGVCLALFFNVVYHREKRSSPLIREFMEVLKNQRPSWRASKINHPRLWIHLLACRKAATHCHQELHPAPPGTNPLRALMTWTVCGQLPMVSA